jgi:molybdopterin-biosynthesis enzyme MoeA-like protein
VRAFQTVRSGVHHRGIGPTHDDVTITAIAQAFGRIVIRHPLLEEVLRRHYGGRSRPPTRMAEVPGGGQLVGKGPGLSVVAFRNVFIFPGIPEVVRRKFESIRERFREQPFILRRVFLRCDEGHITDDLHDVLGRFPDIQLGSYPFLGHPDYTVMLTLESKDPEYVAQALRFLLDRIPPQSVVRTE